jgi:predicted DNA-binding transcriptional regulator AlpA
MEPEPEERATRVLTIADMIRLGYGDSPTTIWRRVKQGIIPAPYDFGNGMVGFYEREIVAAERDRKQRLYSSRKSGITAA